MQLDFFRRVLVVLTTRLSLVQRVHIARGIRQGLSPKVMMAMAGSHPTTEPLKWLGRRWLIAGAQGLVVVLIGVGQPRWSIATAAPHKTRPLMGEGHPRSQLTRPLALVVTGRLEGATETLKTQRCCQWGTP